MPKPSAALLAQASALLAPGEVVAGSTQHLAQKRAAAEEQEHREHRGTGTQGVGTHAAAEPPPPPRWHARRRAFLASHPAAPGPYAPDDEGVVFEVWREVADLRHPI